MQKYSVLQGIRILIRDRQTKLFLSGMGRWIHDEADAREFPNALNAFNFSLLFGLKNVEIIPGRKTAVINQSRSPGRRTENLNHTFMTSGGHTRSLANPVSGEKVEKL